MPRGAFSSAASAESPKLSLSAAATRGAVSACQTPASPSSQGRIASAISGRTTITPR